MNQLRSLLPLAALLSAALLAPLPAVAAPKKKPKPPSFSVTYEGGGSIQLQSRVRNPTGGTCEINVSEREASISQIEWTTIWNAVPLTASSGRAAKSSAISGRGSNQATNIYNLTGCPGGYNVNDCIAPSVCPYDAGSCAETDLYQTPNYPVLMTVAPHKKKGRFIVTISAEEAAFSPCASGVLNNTFFEESPTTVQFLVVAAEKKKTTTLDFNIIQPHLDCSESVPGLEYECDTSISLSATAKIVGKVSATKLK